MPLFTPAVQSLAEDGQTPLTGVVTLSEGSNVTLTQTGQDIEIAANVDEADVISIGEVGTPLQGVVTLSPAGLVNLNTSGQNIEIEVEAVSSIRKAGEALLTGAVTLSEGTNVSLVQVGQDIEINATPAASGVTTFGESGGTQWSGAVTISEGDNITLTPSGQDVEITASTDPAVTSELSSLDGRLDTAEGEIDALQAADIYLDGRINNVEGGQATASSSASNGTIDSGNTSHTSNEASISITNTSDYRTMAIMYTIVARIYGNADNALTDRLEVSLDLQQNIDGGGYSSTTNMDETFNTDSDNPRPMDRIRTWTGIVTKAPGATFNLSSRVVATWNGAGSSAYIIDNVLVQASAIGVSL